MHTFFRKVKQTLHSGFSWLLQRILIELIYLCFRPQVRFSSPEAKAAARSEACVMVSNHIRGMDGGVILSLLGDRHIRALVAKDWYEKNPWMHFFLSCMPVVPIDREHASLAWLRSSRALLKEGKAIYLCPEGACHFDRVVHSFKPGFVTLASVAGVRILPIYHNGEYHPFFGKRFRMIVGDPITLPEEASGIRSETLQRHADETWSIVRNLELQLNGIIREEEPHAVSH